MYIIINKNEWNRLLLAYKLLIKHQWRALAIQSVYILFNNNILASKTLLHILWWWSWLFLAFTAVWFLQTFFLEMDLFHLEVFFLTQAWQP